MTDKTQFVDTSGNYYTVIKKIGAGGQGKVYTLKGDKLAAKIFLHNKSPTKREKLNHQIKFIKRLDLNNLAIAKPLETLEKPDFGYIMELMTGMVPLKTLMVPPKEESSPIEWYTKTGGLQRRLRLLAQTASILAQLHGKGLVYADPSPDNIFISEEMTENEVHLIDTDNLQYRSSVINSIYTPSFGAPELVQGHSGVNTLTDVHAFAVIAFQTLTMVHPLMGDLITEGEPELEEQALEGRFPWIEHSQDDSNRSSLGIPRELVLSKQVKKLFTQTFEAGLNTPTKRPGMAAWAETLHHAADATLRCLECGYSYYYTEPECPLCECKRPPFVLARLALLDPEVEIEKRELQKEHPNLNVKTIRNIDSFVLEKDTVRLLDDRLIKGNTIASFEVPSLEIEFSEDNLKLRSLVGKTDYWLHDESKQPIFVRDKPKLLSLQELSSWNLHLGKEDKLHRIVNFKLNN